MEWNDIDSQKPPDNVLVEIMYITGRTEKVCYNVHLKIWADEFGCKFDGSQIKLWRFLKQ